MVGNIIVDYKTLENLSGVPSREHEPVGQTRTNEDFNYTQFAPGIFLRMY